MIVEPVPALDLGAVAPEPAALLSAIVRRLEASPLALEATPRRAGFEVRRAAGGDRPAGRPRIHFFAEGASRVVAFFYKPSRLSFSHDRFSYGALYLYGSELGEAAASTLDDALAYLDADFKPAVRPPGLKRSLAFTVPED